MSYQSQASSESKIPDSIVNTLLDPKAYADGRINKAYAWLRKNMPIGLVDKAGFDPFWVVTKYADIREISRRNNDFHSGDRAGMLMDQAGLQQILALTEGKTNFISSLVFMDPPDHQKYRALTQRWFMPANIKKIEQEVRVIARKAVDRLIAKDGECDFVREVALEYPLHVIMNILGVPEQDEALMLKLTQEMFGGQDPEVSGAGGALSGEELANYHNQNVATFGAYFKKLGEERRREPRQDLATVIATAQIDGKPIGEQEEIGYYITVATAGHDTTSSSTATAMHEIAKNPELLRSLKENPSLIPSMIDEAIRWGTPIKHFMRSAVGDVRISGVDLKANDWIMLCYASANRDECEFDKPDVFQVDRKNSQHVSFGYGAHICLGQHLAKMEMRVLFEELIPRLSEVSLNGEAPLSEYWFINGLKNLPIKYKIISE